MSHLVRRLLVGGSLTALAVGLFAAPAAAHVTVSAPNATQGGFTVLTFRVPTERDVPTMSMKVQFPGDQPLRSVSVKPKAGWQYTVTRATLDTPIKDGHGEEITEAVSVIEWTSATGIRAGEFDEFQVSVGPLPEVDQMVFKVIQTYQGGEEVAWIQEPAPDGAEPDRPAPVLTLAAASEEPGGAEPAVAEGETESTGVQADDGDSAGPSTGSVTAALVLGVLGFGSGVAGLGLGLLARRAGARAGNTASS